MINKNNKNFKVNNKKNFSKMVYEFLGNLFFCYCVIVALALIMFSSVTIECEVIGSSMYPTLNNLKGAKQNDVVFVNIYDKQLSYKDIVVVKTDSENIIKRVVGLPGDRIDIVLVDHQYLLERNGEIVDENYICYTISPSTPTKEQNGMDKTFQRFQELRRLEPDDFESNDEGLGVGKYIVPENSIFVLGDNRAVSLDSSHYGAFDISKLEGKVELIKNHDQSDFSFYYYYILEGKFFYTLARLFA